MSLETISLGGILRTEKLGSGAIVHNAITVFKKKTRQENCKFKGSLYTCLKRFVSQTKWNNIKQEREENTIKYNLKIQMQNQTKTKFFHTKWKNILLALTIFKDDEMKQEIKKTVATSEF